MPNSCSLESHAMDVIFWSIASLTAERRVIGESLSRFDALFGYGTFIVWFASTMKMIASFPDMLTAHF